MSQNMGETKRHDDNDVEMRSRYMEVTEQERSQNMGETKRHDDNDAEALEQRREQTDTRNSNESRWMSPGQFNESLMRVTRKTGVRNDGGRSA